MSQMLFSWKCKIIEISLLKHNIKFSANFYTCKLKLLLNTLLNNIEYIFKIKVPDGFQSCNNFVTYRHLPITSKKRFCRSVNYIPILDSKHEKCLPLITFTRFYFNYISGIQIFFILTFHYKRLMAKRLKNR